MTSVSDVAQNSAKSLGPSAYLVNVLPSLVLVSTVFALVGSRLYPWLGPLHDVKGNSVPRGLESIGHIARDLSVTDAVLLLFVALLVAVLLRPFQVTAVQVLEGYWRRGLLDSFAVELHARRLSTSLVKARMVPSTSAGTEFDAVAKDSRHARRTARMSARAGRVVETYPDAIADILPTSLGNVLRRAETSAGERYGLGTVITYPRLFPFISSKLGAEIATQLDLIDALAAFTLVFSAQALVAAPLLVLVNWWSLLPVAFIVFSLLSYRGARRAAMSYAVRLAAGYDLHRFDMLRGMHRPLPDDAEQEYADNEALTAFLRGVLPIDPPERAGWKYVHPDSSTADPSAEGP